MGVTFTVGAKQFIVLPKFQFEDSRIGVLFGCTTKFRFIFTVCIESPSSHFCLLLIIYLFYIMLFIVEFSFL